MKSDIKKIYIALLFMAISPLVSANIWKPMNAGLVHMPVMATAGKDYIAVVTIGKTNDVGREYALHFWNGFTWGHSIPFTLDSTAQIRAMQAFEGSVYIAGAIKNVKGLENVEHIFRYNLRERQFQSVMSGTLVNLMKEINAMAVYDGKLVIGGSFTKVQNVLSNNLIYFNGTTWIYPGLDFGTGFDGPVTRLLVEGDTLFAGGLFKNADQLFSQFYAAYYNGNWIRYENNSSPLSNMVYFDQSIVTTIKDGGVLHFSQVFRNGTLSISNGIAAIHTVKQLAVFDGQLWAAGYFRLTGSLEDVYLIRFVDGKWVPAPGADYMTQITTLVTAREKLYAGGRIIEPSLGLRNMAEYAPGRAAVSGTVFFDKNANCTYDTREEFLAQHYVVIRPGNIYAKPDDFGRYRAFVPAGKYEISVLDRKYWTYSPCQSAYSVEVGAGSIHDSLDFAMTYVDIVEDVNIDLTALGGWEARDGQRNYYVLQYGNVGSENIHNGRVVLNFNETLKPGFQFFPTPDSTYNDRAVWYYSNLNAGDKRKVAFSVEIPEAFPQNEVSYTAMVDPTENETYTEDNQSSLQQTITDSTFENEKYIFPSPEEGQSYAVIPMDEKEVAFNITFANYSYDTVRTIYVIDTIDTDLDLQFIQETGSSHSYTTKVINGPPGSNEAVIIWTFKDIDLHPNPSRASDNFNYSGYIGFKFRFNNPLPEGTVITNRARIILDYEYEEMTNQVEGRVQRISGIQNGIITQSDAVVYPNPVSGSKVNVKLDGNLNGFIPQVRLTDMVGTTWEPLNVAQKGSELEVSIPGLPSGTYVISVSAPGNYVLRKRICVIR